MFTGIIQDVGRLAERDRAGGESGDMRLRVAFGTPPTTPLALGDSIAVSGTCLTVTELSADGFWADASKETLALTTLGGLRPGDEVNLECALTPATPLGGHLVSGHVDGVGEVLSRTADARSVRFSLCAPDALARYIAQKGSICIDGVSLTVNRVEGTRFDVNIIPHTLDATTMHAFEAGRMVNLEVDLIARYLERLLEARTPASEA